MEALEVMVPLQVPEQVLVSEELTERRAEERPWLSELEVCQTPRGEDSSASVVCKGLLS